MSEQQETVTGLGPGVHRITSEEYHDDPCIIPSVSRGTIKTLINQTPQHVWHNHPRLNPKFRPDEDEGKFDVGTFAHALFLEGEDAAAVFDYKDWKKAEAQQDRKDTRERGKIPFLRHQYTQVCDMVEAAHEQITEFEELQILDLHHEGDSELTYIWQEGETLCRVRPDWIRKDRKLALDYKTTKATANPMEYHRIILNMAYDIQDSFYRRGIKAIEGKALRFFFLVQETEPPFLASLIGIDPMFQEMGRQKVEYGLFLWNKCMKTGEWPGYPSRACYIEPPQYALTAWEQLSAAIGED